LVEVGEFHGEKRPKAVNKFVDLFYGRKCGEFASGCGWVFEFAGISLGSKRERKKVGYKGRAREWPSRPIDGGAATTIFAR
jgi:hypothetical protein